MIRKDTQMFKFIKKKIEEIVDQKVSDNNRSLRYVTSLPKYKSCEVCGCLVENPIKGQGEIRQKDIWIPVASFTKKEDYIYYPYYCKLHAPEKKINEEGQVEEVSPTK